MSVQVGPWPWSLLTALSVAVWIAAVITAWTSADRVVHKNRGWTRAWRILLTFLCVSVGGVALAFGAVYVLVRYHQPSRSPADRSVVA
jgi:putative flippase GtrA